MKNEWKYTQGKKRGRCEIKFYKRETREEKERMVNKEYDGTYIAARLGHKFLQFVHQASNFLGVLLDAAQFFLVEIRCDLLTEDYLRDHVADVGWPGSSFCNESKNRSALVVTMAVCEKKKRATYK